MKELIEKKFFENNITKKKNLLFFTGHLRTIEHLIKFHKKFMINNDSDLAITTWMDDSNSSELIVKIQKILKPIYFEIEEFNFNKTTQIFGNLNKFDYVFGKSALSTRSRVYKMLRT